MSKSLHKAISDRLEQLEVLEKDLSTKNTNSKLFRTFWKGLVRDHNGKWDSLFLHGIKYFQYGAQPEPDLTNDTIVSFLTHAIGHERQFLIGLENGAYYSIKNWLILLHKEQSYKGIGGKLLSEKLVSSHEHTDIVNLTIIPLADKYGDTYESNGRQTVNLPDIDPQGLPIDEWVHDQQVMHHYPNPKHLDQYLRIMKRKLEEFVASVGKASNRELLEIIATYYQYAVNTHMFEAVNQSLFANHANIMLELIGLERIPQGITDFAAMRLQPQSFINFFIDEVKEYNPHLTQV